MIIEVAGIEFPVVSEFSTEAGNQIVRDNKRMEIVQTDVSESAWCDLIADALNEYVETHKAQIATFR